MLYNSYAVSGYTYEDYKKTSWSRIDAPCSAAKKDSAGVLALKIIAVVVFAIIAITAGLNCAPSAEKISAGRAYSSAADLNEAEGNTIFF